MLSPLAQLAWIKLLCHVKRQGVKGTAKALSPNVAGKKWEVGAVAVEEMETAAIRDGALYRENGTWTLTAWKEYQLEDQTNAERQRRFRANKRNGA